MVSDNVIKHLEMLQGVINRMAHNSFLLKGWTVTLAAASFWLLGRDELPSGGKLGIMIVVAVFWGLDGYFLRQERLFRALYNRVRLRENTDFSMDISPIAGDVPSWTDTCIGDICKPNTIFVFYGMIGLAILIIL
ncbi:MAG: hypothetical protein ACR2QC_06820 [Gammaproteobacteria bacterium]